MIQMVVKKKDRILDLVKAICHRVKEKEGYLNKTKLIKYLYLIDVEYYRNHGETFTRFNWVFYDYGPWAYEYNDIFDDIKRSPDFVVKEGTRPDLDTQFISTSEEIGFDSIFEDVADELNARRIVDRWADEALSPMLNYVYFYTEPMEEAERHQPLDFTKIDQLEPIPRFELTRGNLTAKERERIREKIKKRRNYSGG